MKIVPIRNKSLITTSIRTLVRRGEKKADTVKIVGGRYYGEHDLKDFSFTVEGITPGKKLAICGLTPQAEGDQLEMLWEIGSDFTGENGMLRLSLRAVSPDGSVCIQFDGGEIEVSGAEASEYLPAEPPSEQALEQLENALAAAKKEIGEEVAKEAEKAVSGKVEQEVAGQVEKAVSGLDIGGMIQAALPQDLVVSGEVRDLKVLTEEEFRQLDTPSEDTLYVLV